MTAKGLFQDTETVLAKASVGFTPGPHNGTLWHAGIYNPWLRPCDQRLVLMFFDLIYLIIFNCMT